MVTPAAAQSNLIDAMLAPKAIRAKVDAALAAKSLETQKKMGEMVMQMLDDAADAGGAGRGLDVFA